MEAVLKRCSVDIATLQKDLKFMQAQWSDNFFGQVNETQSNVRHMSQDIEAIRSLSDNLVLRSDLDKVYAKFNKMATLD